ncbi:outer membrane-specific lipoprotein transporter subunit LolE [compost metagenome]
MGAKESMVRYIFLFEGLLISMVGTIVGLSLGALFCYIQQRFGLIRMGQSGSFIMDNYPVDMKFRDFVLVFITVFAISFVASWVASRLSVRNFTNVREELTEQ